MYSVQSTHLALMHLHNAKSGGTDLEGLTAFLAARGHAVTIACRSHAAAPHPAVRFTLIDCAHGAEAPSAALLDWAEPERRARAPIL